MSAGPESVPPSNDTPSLRAWLIADTIELRSATLPKVLRGPAWYMSVARRRAAWNIGSASNGNCIHAPLELCALKVAGKPPCPYGR